MKIKKVLNNNVVLVENDNNAEMVVMGRGLAFKKKSGEDINPSLVDKIFVLETKGLSDKLAQLINEIPPEHLDLSDEVITYAKSELPGKISDNIYLTLTDHISFSISRFQQGFTLKNALLWELKKFYRHEFEVALHALQIIERKTGYKLPEDEAGSIALHLINAQQSQNDMGNTMNMTKIINDVLTIVKYHYGLEVDENSINYSRFVTHLRYFSYRLTQNESTIEGEKELYKQVKKKYPEAYRCTQKIKAYLSSSYDKNPNKDEMLYLMLHIHRITSREKYNN
ncbi:BglG family transcription antiterminator LicT [Bacillus thuringiensis]|uniref:PRD domain-containing protein n=1 Tax=Bacillus cereus TaxID=1396 RepID=A0A9W7Q2U4_BACCE|nr:PRD domain-containing protein [Bacillus cereus]KAA6460482.1 PRD domain-containing protein [Bacillus cereus]KAB2500224.1 PRD domain-containing protein [Bacillus cereus]